MNFYSMIQIISVLNLIGDFTKAIILYSVDVLMEKIPINLCSNMLENLWKLIEMKKRLYILNYKMDMMPHLKCCNMLMNITIIFKIFGR